MFVSFAHFVFFCFITYICYVIFPRYILCTLVMRLNIFAQTVLPPINYDPYVTCAYYNQYVCDAEIHLTLTCKNPRWDTLNYTVCLSQRSNVWNGSKHKKTSSPVEVNPIHSYRFLSLLVWNIHHIVFDSIIRLVIEIWWVRYTVS